MRGIQQGKGYVLIEQRWDDEARGLKRFKYEGITLTCAHCGCVKIPNPKRVRPREWCMKCYAYVCDKRVCITECHPFIQSVELAQNNNGDQAYLPRGLEGEILFDPRKERKIF